ncbi:response regulator [Rugamonas aquatica]|uniref:Response regulator n=1 Tax=Rugamonas aquatica TaxID=2743357 RepID=A0A6A7N4T7_9BURK|nr:response regulator transcription factor [Rugamonas aquatica]MQA39908.1 response regulator [Rugamonas aquatica]
MATASTPPIRVMLVDDHATLLWGLQKLIEGAAPEMQVVATAADPEQAVAEALRTRPDIVLLDLDLEGRSSLEVIPELVLSEARIIILSGNRDEVLLGQAMRLGARGVVGKDAEADVVLAAVRKVHGGQMWLSPTMMTAMLASLINPVASAAKDAEADKIASLTTKELKIVSAVVHSNGAANKELAQQLFVAEPTLRNYLTSIYQKLGVANRLELYVYASKHKLG